MKERWLNFILALTNRIYALKQGVIKEEGIKIISGVVTLFLYEILLVITSIPLYVGLRPAKVVAYFEEKGGYEKISYDYNLRRILTLTSATAILIVWAVKLSVILFTPNIYGPMRLYKISGLEPVDILQQDLIAAETEIQTAEAVENMARPELTGVEKIKGGKYIFRGKGQPLAMVVLFLSDKQTAVYTDKIAENGEWEITYTREDFQLNEGNHSIVAFCYDQERGTRSKISDPQYFKVTTSLLDKLIDNIDIYINLTVIIIIALGIFLIILTI